VQRCMIKSVHKWDSRAKAPEETEETE
jgi:hypothetical protein